MKPYAERPAMQNRCIYCFREQYAIAVWEISHGRHPCVWCGKTPPVLTEQEFREAMQKRDSPPCG